MAPDSPDFRGALLPERTGKKRHPPTVSQGFRRRQRFPAVRISNRSESGNREQRQGAADDIRLRPFSRPAPPTQRPIVYFAPHRPGIRPPRRLRFRASAPPGLRAPRQIRPPRIDRDRLHPPPASPKRARGGAPILSTGIGPYPSNLPTSATGADRTSAPRRIISSNRAAEPNEIRAPPKRGKTTARKRTISAE